MNKLATRGFATKTVVLASGLLAAGLMAACGTPSSSNTATSSSATDTTTSASTSSSAPATTSSGATAQSGSGTPNCTTADLKITLGQGDAGAGHVYTPIVFTNTSNHSCVIQAYPGVSYVTGADDHQVGDPADRTPGNASAVTLASGEAASAALDRVNVDNFDQAQCQPSPVSGLRVYPPNDTTSFVITGSFRACTKHMSQPQMNVKPVQKGANAQ